MKSKVIIGALIVIQILAIMFTTQFLSLSNQPDDTIAFVPQVFSQTPTNDFSQNEKFDFKPDYKESFVISDVNFLLINSLSSLVMILGVVKLLKNENNKKIKTEKLAIIGELSSRIAHDMRNPLSVIQMTLENFKIQYPLSKEQERQFEKINRSIFRITHQIDDIWDFVKSPTAEKKNCSLAHLLQESLRRVNIPANIKIRLPPDDCEILCDDEKTIVVFVNIFINAIQAFENDGNIWVSFDSNKNWITVKIEDDGVGIDPKVLDRIFEPLITTKQTGTGLGLSCCKSIMESQGGLIKASNRPKKGSVFTIHFSKQ
ncbi:MAG: sensor histidine kinase [Nitrosopumilus sp.]|uniref:sensor histidine kinase n=1 Tax=Nitrosopumilus sp. TaxID=2024843 RepID=UPI00242A6079|nr:ATP-binding protein [Nitrosopumilus sp.]MCV0366247.1 sensor histidine kinase [Nitrosopumilus sp.]